MSSRKVRLALLSDLHAYHPPQGYGKAGPSYLPANPSGSDPDPFRNLNELIEREKLRADIVLCAGDICDRADFRGFQYAWIKLNELKSKIGAQALIATCGNHDLNSRLIEAEEDPDPKGALQTATPEFPFEERSLSDHFWARNFTIVTPMPEITVVVLNTSAYHGSESDEINHGRVSQRTIAAIERELRNFPKVADINILLCHHHVRQLKGLWGTIPDTDFMMKGSELLNMLTRCTASPWLVLHGHRHVPNLEHSIDPSFVIVGASSFSKQIQGRLNQFHMLDVDVDYGVPQPLRGTITTWSWNATGRWQQQSISNDDEGFPPNCGFGSVFAPRTLATEIENAFEQDQDYIQWQDLVKRIPDLEFMTPDNFRLLEEVLQQHGINLQRDRMGRVSQVGRST